MFKISLLVALASLSMLVVMASSQKEYYDVAKANDLFETFIRDYNRVYKDDADKELHFKAFVKNLEKINEMNKSSGATFGINKFADNTEEERQSMLGYRKQNTKKE